MKSKLLVVIASALMGAWAFGETVLFNGTPTAGKTFEVKIPSTVITKGDCDDGEFSLWLQTTAAISGGWSWAYKTKPEDCYVTDGKVKSALLNPKNPAWGDSGPRQPGVICELKFAIKSDFDKNNLKLVMSKPPAQWGGSANPNPLRVEVWKGIRADARSWVDNANRCVFIDMSSVPAEEYTFTFPDGYVVKSRQNVYRRRLSEKPKSFVVKVEAKTRKEGIFKADVLVEPHKEVLKAPLPNEKVLVGQCVYGVHERFRDEIITNDLASLLVGWSKATDYTNMPAHIEKKMKENDIHFMTIYGGAGRETTEALKAKWGERYLWNNIGEFSGYLYQDIKSADMCSVPQDAADMNEARNWYINNWMRKKSIDEHRRCDYFFTTSASPLTAYELQGGADFMCAELYPVGAHNISYATSEMRGAVRKWKPEYWGGWLAEEWQTFPIHYSSKQKYDLLKIGLYQQYLMGTSIIVLESGAQTTQAENYTAGANGVKQMYDDYAPKMYRQTVKDFYEWVKKNPRDKGTPETNIALILGNNDSYVGMTHEIFATWAQHVRATTNLNWKCGAPEDTWGLAKDVFFPLGKDSLKPYENIWLAGSPYGQIDIVSVDDEARLSDISRYKLLAYAGWNTMTPNIKKVLATWVKNGGELIIALPHFRATADREFKTITANEMVDGGDMKPLVSENLSDVLKNAKDGLYISRLGKGTVYLLTASTFPSVSKEASNRYQNLLRERASAVVQSVIMTGEDRDYISYAVYPKTIYALNIDTLKDRKVSFNGKEEIFTPGEMKVIKR